MILYDITEKDVRPTKYETHIIGRSGDVTRALSREGSRRVYVKYDHIPAELIKAIIAVEDKRYYKHNGIDHRGILRAIVRAIGSRGRVIQGGSTITQQLIKNTVFVDWTKERTITDKLGRKFNELFLAPRLERRISKRRIIECYLNTIYLGEGCYGVQTASRVYFGKAVWDLELGECAMLAGIPKNPARYDPFRDLKRSISRRNKVLDIMYSQQLISKEERDEEKLKDPTGAIRLSKKRYKELIRPYSWFEDALISEVIYEMERSGLLPGEAWEKLFEGGLRIYSTEDTAIQGYAEKLCSDEDIIPDLDKEDGPQVAVILLDMESGGVLASVGGRGEKTAGRLFDRVSGARRINSTQPMVRAFARLEHTPQASGTNILEMCEAFAMHETKGLFNGAHYYDRVMEHSGRIISETGIKSAAKDEGARLYSHPLPQMWEITVDTDVWVIGRAGKNVLGVWGGYDDNRHIPLKKEYYIYPKTIWKKIAGRVEDNDCLILVNASHPISKEYVPPLKTVTGGQKMHSAVAGIVEQILEDAGKEGIGLSVLSGYRSASRQEHLYKSRVKRYIEGGYSEEQARTQAARINPLPGTSEHQTGLCMDIVDSGYMRIASGNEDTDGYRWMLRHCAEYGFILRYPEDKQDITGIIYEPWHFRYVGIEAAAYIMKNGITLEEYCEKRSVK